MKPDYLDKILDFFMKRKIIRVVFSLTILIILLEILRLSLGDATFPSVAWSGGILILLLGLYAWITQNLK